jgi:hypothetical protein
MHELGVTLKMYPIIRILQIAAYISIFLKGMMIAIPLRFYFLAGLFTAEPSSGIFIALADICLLSLFILTVVEKQNGQSLLKLVHTSF